MGQNKGTGLIRNRATGRECMQIQVSDANDETMRRQKWRENMHEAQVNDCTSGGRVNKKLSLLCLLRRVMKMFP